MNKVLEVIVEMLAVIFVVIPFFIVLWFYILYRVILIPFGKKFKDPFEDIE